MSMNWEMNWCCWKIATDEREFDYWKSEVITFVVLLLYIVLPCRFQGEGQSKKQHF